MTLKVCPECKQELELEEFYKHPKTKDRRDRICKNCKKQSSRFNYLSKKQRNSFMPGDKYISPIDITFTQDEIKLLNNLIVKEGLNCFSDAFKYSVLKSIDEKLFFTSNAFSLALSVLDENYSQLLYLKNNLVQMHDAYLRGRLPNVWEHIDIILENIVLCTEQISKIINIRRKILIHSP